MKCGTLSCGMSYTYDERLLLKDILLAIHRIETFTKGMSYESFVADEKTLNAVTYNFLVIGEAVKLLPESLTRKYPGGSLEADRRNERQAHPCIFFR